MGNFRSTLASDRMCNPGSFPIPWSDQSFDKSIDHAAWKIPRGISAPIWFHTFAGTDRSRLATRLAFGSSNFTANHGNNVIYDITGW